MKITLEKNDLAELSVDIPEEHYIELWKITHYVSSIFGLSKKQKEALEYLKVILNSLSESQQEILLQELRLTRSDVYGYQN